MLAFIFPIFFIDFSLEQNFITNKIFIIFKFDFLAFTEKFKVKHLRI